MNIVYTGLFVIVCSSVVFSYYHLSFFQEVNYFLDTTIQTQLLKQVEDDYSQKKRIIKRINRCIVILKINKSSEMWELEDLVNFREKIRIK